MLADHETRAGSKSTTIDLRHGIGRRVYTEGYQWGARINSCSPAAEHWFTRCILICDDFGTFVAEPEQCLLRAAPMRTKDYGAEQVEQWLDELEAAGLLHRYTVNGKLLATMIDAPPCASSKNGKLVEKWEGPPPSEGLIQAHHRWGHVYATRDPGESGLIRVDPENPDDPDESTGLQEQEQRQGQEQQQQQQEGEQSRSLRVGPDVAAADFSPDGSEQRRAALQHWGIAAPRATAIAGQCTDLTCMDIHLLGLTAERRRPQIDNKPGWLVKTIEDDERPAAGLERLKPSLIVALVDRGLVESVFGQATPRGSLTVSHGKLCGPHGGGPGECGIAGIVLRDLSGLDALVQTRGGR